MTLTGRQGVVIFTAFAFAYFFSALLRAVTATLAPVFSAELDLRAADLGLLAGAYFYLGLANFKMGDSKVPDEKRILDAVRFNEQCAAIKSPFQAPAQRNIKAIRQQFHIK